jgi:hypothetical protein
MGSATTNANKRAGCVKWLTSECKGAAECTCIPPTVPEPRRKRTPKANEPKPENEQCPD